MSLPGEKVLAAAADPHFAERIPVLQRIAFLKEDELAAWGFRERHAVL